MLVAGDLFDNPNISPATMQRTAAILDGVKPRPVIAIIGNHDIQPNTTWLDYLVQAGLLKFPPFEFQGVRIAGQHYSYTNQADLEKLNPRADILMLHGGVDTKESSSFSSEYLHSLDIPYIAMGHIHATSIDRNIYMPGSLESTKYDEYIPNNGHVFLDGQAVPFPARRHFIRIVCSSDNNLLLPDKVTDISEMVIIVSLEGTTLSMEEIRHELLKYGEPLAIRFLQASQVRIEQHLSYRPDQIAKEILGDDYPLFQQLLPMNKRQVDLTIKELINDDYERIRRSVPDVN